MGTKRLVLAELWQAECWQAVTEMEGKMHLPSHFVLGKKSMQITANALNQLIVFEELEGGKLAENCYYQYTQFMSLYMPLLYTLLENYKSNNKTEVFNTVILSQYYRKKPTIFFWPALSFCICIKNISWNWKNVLLPYTMELFSTT